MITRIEALNYRCLRYIRQDLGPFHVLVGPNASGKTTFLDVVEFLGQLVSEGLEEAVVERTQRFHDLIWKGRGNHFELAIEMAIPDSDGRQFGKLPFDRIRYEVSIGLDDNEPPDTLMTRKSPATAKTVISKTQSGRAVFASEVMQGSGKGWLPTYDLGPRKSGLANLPADENRFPISTWLRKLLSEGVHKFILISLEIWKASPPLRSHGFRTDGSNLPWAIEALRRRSRERFDAWIEHVKTPIY